MKIAARIKLVMAIISLILPILDDVFQLIDEYRENK